MTGTSLDGLDAALVEITGEGLDMTAKFHRLVSKPLAGLASTLRHFAEGRPAPPIDYMRAARQLGELHAEAVAELIGDAKIDFVVAHGQTIWHAPRDEAGHLSWQLFDPWPVVRRLRVPVCYDLRQADLIAGGEGAPITPIADWVLFRERVDAVVNLGGIMNLSRIAGDVSNIAGGDIGPCNILLDGLCKRLFAEAFDRDGRLASQGSVYGDAYSTVLAAMVDLAEGSLGREVFSEHWVDALLNELRAGGGEPCDFLRSAIDAIAFNLARCLESLRCRRIAVAGGGAKNPVLVKALQDRVFHNEDVLHIDSLGSPCDAREAVCFAVLGALSQDGVPITLPQVTHADSPARAGVWAFP